MDPPGSQATSHAEVEAKAKAARVTSALVLKTKSDQMAFLIGSSRRMEKKISDILLNQKSLERIVETKFQDPDVKVTELTNTVNQLQ
ncbi:Nucleolysin TIAR [Hordeum vulgare]|nr:Nucleolysin TIAR [Hordeum vulgare]